MTKAKQHSNKEFAEFELAFLRAIDQTSRGEGRISTPEKILARRIELPKSSLKAGSKNFHPN